MQSHGNSPIAPSHLDKKPTLTRFAPDSAYKTHVQYRHCYHQKLISHLVYHMFLWKHSPYLKRKHSERLLDLSVMTRPDITYAVSTLLQQLENPSITHLEFAWCVIWYLKGTKSLCLIFGGTTPSLCGYSNTDWASTLDRHSISGFAFFLGNRSVLWSSKKQPIVTLLSTESEYVTLTHAANDVIWIHKLLAEISPIYPEWPPPPSTLFCDNQDTICLSKDSTFHARTKHIDVHFHFIRQTVSQNQISLDYIPTMDMIVDIFTKSLSFHKFSGFRSLLGVHWDRIIIKGEC